LAGQLLAERITSKLYLVAIWSRHVVRLQVNGQLDPGFCPPWTPKHLVDYSSTKNKG